MYLIGTLCILARTLLLCNVDHGVSGPSHQVLRTSSTHNQTGY